MLFELQAKTELSKMLKKLWPGKLLFGELWLDDFIPLFESLHFILKFLLVMSKFLLFTSSINTGIPQWHILTKITLLFYYLY